MIKISINKKLDYDVYDDFKDFSVEGADFGTKIKRDYPNITANNFKDYIDLFYEDNAEIFQKCCDDMNAELLSKQIFFFDTVGKVFGFDASNENFHGYVSMFDCNPRFIDSKEFQIFYGKEIEDKTEVVFHEILHFIFFDYCSRNLSQETGSLEKNSGKLWELSEIFNVIVLNMPEFRDLLGREEKLFYPELKTKLAAVKNVWNKGYNLKEFILQSLLVLNNK